MPTSERTAHFDRDWERLEAADRARFRSAVNRFAEDLRRGRIRSGLRVERVQGTDGVFEMTWSPDGRATFEYGAVRSDEAHSIWRRIERHEVLRRP